MATRNIDETPAVQIPLPDKSVPQPGTNPRRKPPRTAEVAPPPNGGNTVFEVAASASYQPQMPDLYYWMTSHQSAVRELADAKAFEYGSTDLQIMAGAMVQMFPGIEPGEALQASIAFYSLGKISRVISSFKEGRPAPADSWRDLEVYAMMAQRIMEQGGWP